MADIFDVLSDPTRRDLLTRLRDASAQPDGELSVGALVEQTGLSQPTVSKHLKVLREQGLVSVREEAQHRFYRIDAAPLAAVAEWVAAFVAESPPRTAKPPADPMIPWSGANAGEQIGRAAATTLHHAQAVLHALRETTEEARERLADVADIVKATLPTEPVER